MKNAIGGAVAYEERHAADDLNALKTHAEHLVNNAANNILVAAGGTQSLIELMNARIKFGLTSKPIVFTSAAINAFSPPIVADRYLTGVNARTSDLDPDRLDKVFELIGRPADDITIGVLDDQDRTNRPAVETAMHAKAALLNTTYGANIVLNFQRLTYSARIASDIATAFTTNFQNASAVVVAADPLFYDQRASVIAAAATLGPNPTIYQWRKFVEDDGLISYGTNLTQAYQSAGQLINAILADMALHNGVPSQTQPIVTINNPELVYNTNTATTQGINVPASMNATPYP